jgi:sulfofructose kinase
MKPKPASACPLDVVGLGQNSIDHVCRVKVFPAVGTKTDALSYHMLSGGQVATAVLQAHRLGLRSCYVGAVGDDELARSALALLRAEGVRLEVKTVPGARTQFALIVVDDSGERTIVESYDPATVVTEGDLRQELFASTRILHLDITDVPAAIRAARWTHEAGGLVSLDIDRLLPGTPDLLGLVDLLIASENLPQELDSPDPKLALHTLRRLCPGFVCITCGERGSVALDGEEAIFTPAFDVEVVDTTGCGDAFRGALLRGVLEEQPMAEALRFASAAAALQAMALGAQSGVPTLEQVTSFLASRPPVRGARAAARRAR